MRLAKGIQDNLLFLIAEVGSQTKTLQKHIQNGEPNLARRVLDRGGYAYNLRLRIHESCIKHLAHHKGGELETLNLRGIEHIATDLERIAELGRECMMHLLAIRKIKHINTAAYMPMLKDVSRGISLIAPSISGSDTRVALQLGDIKLRLDKAYARQRQRYTKDLKKKKQTEDLISGLFVAHGIEQMGNALLGISESIISANLGQPLSIERYHSLQASVALLEKRASMDEPHIEHIADTRSGSGISGIVHPDDKTEGYVAIYKDGEKRKLREEREGVESWHEIYPGLAPKILSYHKRGQSASLLIEHLPGLTFEQILLHESSELLTEALNQLGKTLNSVWRETQTRKKVKASFMLQTEKRISSVYSIHPEFMESDATLCGYKTPSFDTLLKRAKKFEENLIAPFSVYIHGDFNVDNIIYDPEEKRINYIDLHRSCYMDYVQDISVFMVSNYRLQILDAPLRRRIMELAQAFYGIAAQFAQKQGDDTFELRLALGLARSFVTSTRFILDKSLAQRMFLRSRYLIEQVLALESERVAEYRVPIKEMFID